MAGRSASPPPRGQSPPPPEPEDPALQHLLPEERNRRLILHLDVTQVLIMSDLENGLTTDQVLNEILAEMAWGVLDTETGEWVIESEQPTLGAPDRSMISYAQYIMEKYPAGEAVDQTTQAENRELQTKAKHRFTAKGEPGQKFRGVYDQLVKNMTVPNGVKKGFQISKIQVDETALPEDPNADWATNLVRFGRYRIIPSFFKLLQELNREKRMNATIVLRSPSAKLLEDVAVEINNFCNTKHPLYSGSNRTKKAILNGEKGSINFQLMEESKGKLDTSEEVWYMSFDARNSAPPPPPKKEDPLGLGDDDMEEPKPEFVPTQYDGFQQIYAGVVKEVTLERPMCMIEGKVPKDAEVEPPAVMLVDSGDTGVHQIYAYAGTKPLNVALLDAVDGAKLPVEKHQDMFLRVDPYRAITELGYFLEEIKGLEAMRTQRLLDEKQAPLVSGAEMTLEELRALPVKEYLYRTVLPALLPGLQVITRDRPPDPVLWLALYLLRHPKQYNKVLLPNAPAAAPGQPGT
jgi:hypothetical protein